MRLFPHSFKFQMDSLYISWQLSHSRKKTKKNTHTQKKRGPDKESVQGEEESGVPSGGGQNGKHFLFFLFSTALFPLTPGLNPELLKKPPHFGAISLEWCVIMPALLQWRVCAYTGWALRCRPGDLPPACFLDSHTITNQHRQREEEEVEEGVGGDMS